MMRLYNEWWLSTTTLNVDITWVWWQEETHLFSIVINKSIIDDTIIFWSQFWHGNADISANCLGWNFNKFCIQLLNFYSRHLKNFCWNFTANITIIKDIWAFISQRVTVFYEVLSSFNIALDRIQISSKQNRFCEWTRYLIYIFQYIHYLNCQTFEWTFWVNARFEY